MSQHKLSQVQLLEEGEVVPQASTQELELLTDSSLKHGPWSWSRCDSEAELLHTEPD